MSLIVSILNDAYRIASHVYFDSESGEEDSTICQRIPRRLANTTISIERTIE